MISVTSASCIAAFHWASFVTVVGAAVGTGASSVLGSSAGGVYLPQSSGTASSAPQTGQSVFIPFRVQAVPQMHVSSEASRGVSPSAWNAHCAGSPFSPPQTGHSPL